MSMTKEQRQFLRALYKSNRVDKKFFDWVSDNPALADAVAQDANIIASFLNENIKDVLALLSILESAGLVHQEKSRAH